jgi:hypothetical protein
MCRHRTGLSGPSPDDDQLDDIPQAEVLGGDTNHGRRRTDHDVQHLEGRFPAARHDWSLWCASGHPDARRDVKKLGAKTPAELEDPVIDGVHVLLYSSRAEAVRIFLRETLGLALADPTPEWPILALPPAEIAVHPTEGAARAEVYLMTRDLDATLRELRAKGVVVVREPEDQR